MIEADAFSGAEPGCNAIGQSVYGTNSTVAYLIRTEQTSFKDNKRGVW